MRTMSTLLVCSALVTAGAVAFAGDESKTMTPEQKAQHEQMMEDCVERESAMSDGRTDEALRQACKEQLKARMKDGKKGAKSDSRRDTPSY